MLKTFKAPELKLVGEAGEVVMGLGTGGVDFPQETGSDFEFEHDSL